ncbi:MAG: dUTP diphosphatase [Alphaproteobacteria bacterium]|nr:dUTP diphosphatase [Alphaproteobacteria bacterium]MBN2780058.1 dUTP diphosphatase [Alphaproteobacteria bacterium]
MHYKHDTDAGFDFRYAGDVPLTLAFGDRLIVPTGIKVSIPQGFELQVRPRSGLAAKEGIGIVNAPGTIDKAYQGEIKVMLTKLSKSLDGVEDPPFVIEPGMRIAQGVFSEFVQADFKVVETFEEKSSRGDKGLGSTGLF